MSANKVTLSHKEIEGRKKGNQQNYPSFEHLYTTESLAATLKREIVEIVHSGIAQYDYQDDWRSECSK